MNNMRMTCLEFETRNTRAMCEHVVKVENATGINIEGSGNSESRKTDRCDTSRVHEVKSAAPTRLESTESASPRRTDASNRIDEPSECRVQLFERNELQVEYVVGSVYIYYFHQYQ